MTETNLQLCINELREKYGKSGIPLLEQVCKAHRITQREFATIFGISKGHAEAVIKQEVFPSLELGIKIARYFECTVEELFGWRIDDTGARRPLLVPDGKGKWRRLNAAGKRVRALELIGGCGEVD